ncbi:hypothetical protein KCG44_09115 [Pacificimonas sp. WHA3]|uniref:Alkaline proteinase inhibitor/ Outer membrane lipoprotein Omp19 domain-containing protein n=1 Tax=Pacificimonas pallii TaxID=2827236 RepID=A0ABS6SEV7_9SPHN|nr:hypothetical protein [Pacificimonas pallii]MBV7256940.1 hypothetical protein [Pacificimonas pallii]
MTRTSLVGVSLAVQLLAACSPADRAETEPARTAAAVSQDPTVGNAQVPDGAKSRILSKREFQLRGSAACEIVFTYAGRSAETLFWEEPCAGIRVKLLAPDGLIALNRWKSLDPFEKQFVVDLPNSEVLYVEGAFSASIFPIGTAGTVYEVPVAD